MDDIPQTPALPTDKAKCLQTRNPLEIDMDESRDYEILITKSKHSNADQHQRAASYHDRSRNLMSNPALSISRLTRAKSTHFHLHPQPRRQRIPTVESSEECKSELQHSHVLTLNTVNTMNAMNRRSIVDDDEILSDDSMEDMYQEHSPTPIPDDTITPMTHDFNNNPLAFDASINCSVGMGVDRDRRYRHIHNASGSLTSMTMNSVQTQLNQPQQGRTRMPSITCTPMRLSADAIDVKLWLENDVELPQYYDNFINYGYESLRFIKEISTKEQLEDIGVVIKGHQTKLMAEIAKLSMMEDNHNQPEGVSGK